MSGRCNLYCATGPIREGEDVMLGLFRFWISGIFSVSVLLLVFPLPLFGGYYGFYIVLVLYLFSYLNVGYF
jgi:hypothetical protein